MTAGPGPHEAAHQLRLFAPKPVNVERARGAWLWTDDGRRILDLGGANHGAANLGHAHPRVVRAIQDQAARVLHLPATVPSTARDQFLDRLHRFAPGHLARSFLSNGGTEGIEAALKFAMAATGRTGLVAARNAFHGRTLGSLAVTHRPQYRKPFEPVLAPTQFVPLNDEAALEAAVTDQTAAVILEPIQGEGGVVPATAAYLRAAQRVAQARGALLIIDEVQTGMGRTGHDLAHTAAGIRPDLLVLGKSIAGGLPLAATLLTDDVAGKLQNGLHGSTFGGSPIACAAGVAALDVLREEALSARAATEGQRLLDRFRKADIPLVREVRGAGLMIGLDLRIKPPPVLERLLSRGFLALPAGNTVLRLLPPLTTARADLEAAATAIEDVLRDPGLRPDAPTAREEAA